MKYIYFLFLSLNLYSQNIDYLKSQDTLYLILDAPKSSVITKNNNISYSKGTNGYITIYKFQDKEHRSVILQTFNTDQGYGRYNFKVRTSKFLQKNKNSVVTTDFIDEHGLGEFFVGVIQHPKTKVIYIINLEDLKKRKLIIKRASIIDNFSMDI